MRLFIAMELNVTVVQNLTELVGRLSPCASITWVHPQNMHVTLKYVGDWPVHRLEELVRALHQVNMPTPLHVPLAGLGFFPNTRNPRVFWAGAENTPPLRQLASQVDAVLQDLGIAPEVRPYYPHLTLGRITDHESIDELHRLVDELPSREFGTIFPDKFVLFESTLTAAVPIYRRIATFIFVPPLRETALESTRPMFAGKL